MMGSQQETLAILVNTARMKVLHPPSSLRRPLRSTLMRAAQVLQPIMTFPSIHDINHLYFVTASISGWKHLLAEPKYRQIVLDSLVWLQKEKRMILFAFVIMPPHLHLILKPTVKTIGEVLQEFGSYTAHSILSDLRKDNLYDLLKFFHEQRRDARHKHSIW